MNVVLWRITRAAFASTAFSGEGAFLYGGRWNSPGTRVVYCASSRSLAILELLVHLDRTVRLAHLDFVLIRAELANTLVDPTPALPPNWRTTPAPLANAALGDRWAKSDPATTRPALRLPSALVPDEPNYLLNPLHPHFPQLTIAPPAPLALDPRLTA